MFRQAGLVLLSGVLGLSFPGAQEKPPTPWVDSGRGVPVLAEGRVLPLDTWSRIVYSRISGRDQDGDALGWLLSLLIFPEKMDSEPSILVNDPDVLAGTGVSVPSRGRYSARHLAALFPLAEGWQEQFADDPTPKGRELYRLGRALELYLNLSLTFSQEDPRATRSPFLCLDLGSGGKNPAQALGTQKLGPKEKDRLGLLLYWENQSKSGNWDEAAAALKLFSGDAATLELFHNRVPWTWVTAFFGVLGLGSGWFFRNPKAAPFLRGFSGAAFATVTLWITLRVVISGHPPVTNLGSTFLLVSWIASGAAFFLSFKPAQRQTSLLSLAAGAALPFLSSAFQTGSDPFSPVQAVLNTNFWLGIHVTAIICGYAGTFGAGILGHAYLWSAGFKKPAGNLLGLWKNLQITLLFGLALTLAGTLLGGFWADQSWGRFWGWDPKENGALLVILWLATTLHLKPAGVTQEWGTAFAAACGIPVLLFSWLGVNLLAQGFHSYGFAPDKALVFFGLLAADSVVLGLFTLRKVLR